MTDLPDGTYTAVVDRHEDDLFALELSNDDDARYELLVDPATLPDPAQEPDAVLEVTIRDGALEAVSYDPDATDERAADAQSRFDRLSRRPPDDG